MTKSSSNSKSKTILYDRRRDDCIILDISLRYIKFLINALYVTSPDNFVVVSAAMSSAVMSSMMRKIIREVALDKTTLQFKLPSCKNWPLAASGILNFSL